MDLENPEMDQIECFQQHWMDKKITLKINIMQVSRSKMFTHLQIQPPLQKTGWCTQRSTTGKSLSLGHLPSFLTMICGFCQVPVWWADEKSQCERIHEKTILILPPHPRNTHHLQAILLPYISMSICFSLINVLVTPTAIPRGPHSAYPMGFLLVLDI